MAETAALGVASSGARAGVMLDLTEQDRPPAATNMPLLLLREAASRLSYSNAADVSGVLMGAVSPTELRAAEQPLAALDAYLANDQYGEATVALLQDAPARLTLLCLVSSVVRLHPPVTAPSANVASLVLSIAQKMLSTISVRLIESLPALEFTAKLVRTQALQGAARQLAALTEPLGLQAEAASCFQAGGDEVPQPRLQAAEAAGLPRHATHLALRLLHFVYNSVTAVCRQLDMRAYWEVEDNEARAQALGNDLADALAGGYVLEHAARALLLLAPAAVRDTASEELLQGVLNQLSFMYFQLSSRFRDSASADLQGADRLRLALRGLCLQHAMMVIGLSAVGAAGGGCTYGLPQPLLHGLTLGLLTEHSVSSSVSEDGDVQGLGPEPEPVRRMEYRWPWDLLELLSSEALAALMGRRTALTLALQVGHLMVLQTELNAYSSATGGGGGSRHLGGDGAVMHPVLQAHEAAALVALALKVARSLCLAATGSARRRGSGEEAVAWWSLALSAARHAVWRMINGDMEEYITSLVSALTSGAVLDAGLCQLPLDPPLDVAAALAVGFLPFLEGLLRRAACTGNAYDADLARRLLLRQPVEHTRRLLLPLLAYGEVREAAALLATVAKVVRQTAPDWAECFASSRTGLEAAVAILSAAALQPPAAQPDAPVHDGVGDGGSSNSVAAAAASPASQRLTAMLAFAACKVLPALAWVWRREVQHTEHMRGSFSEPEAAPPQVRARKRRLVGTLATVLEPLLDWVLLLSVRCLRNGGGHGAGGCGAAEGASPSHAAGSAAANANAAAAAGLGNTGAGPGAAAADDAGGWRRLLLEEVGAEQLLGAALGLAPDLAEEGVPHSRISQLLQRLTACCIAVTLVVEEAGTAGSAAGAATTRPAWDPQLLRSLSVNQLVLSGCQTTAEDALTLALRLKNPAIPVSLREDCVPAPTAALAAALPAPAQGRALLRTCANRDCANLEGDTEAELALLSCAVCGEVGYCSRACQVAHRRAGHKGACRARRPGGQGAAVRSGTA